MSEGVSMGGSKGGREGGREGRREGRKSSRRARGGGRRERGEGRALGYTNIDNNVLIATGIYFRPQGFRQKKKPQLVFNA